MPTSLSPFLAELFEFSTSPISMLLMGLIAVLVILLILAIYFPSVKRFLVAIYALEEDESPKSFLAWIVSVVVIVRLVQVFMIQPFIVDGASMVPTFQNNDLLLIDKISYRLREPRRGEVVVFKFHMNGSVLDGNYFIKRLIGLPGDTIVINGTSTIITTRDGETIIPDESFIEHQRSNQSFEIVLGDNEYFVEGDNRDGSYDSRSWGPITKEQFAGRALVELYNKPKLLPGAREY